MQKLKNLVIEGPIAAGKTKLAQMFKLVWESELWLDTDLCNNYWVSQFHTTNQYAFECSLAYLTERAINYKNHMAKFKTKDKKLIISDFSFIGNSIFQKTILQQKEYELIQKTEQLILGTIPLPNIIVYLMPTLDMLRANLKRKLEEVDGYLVPNLDQLEAVMQNYKTYFANFNEADTKLITVDLSKKNPLTIKEDFILLCNKIEEEHQSNLIFFN